MVPPTVISVKRTVGCPTLRSTRSSRHSAPRTCAGVGWFASYAPADKPRYAVVFMVTQGGTGAGKAPKDGGVGMLIHGLLNFPVDLGDGLMEGPEHADQRQDEQASWFNDGRIGG